MRLLLILSLFCSILMAEVDVISVSEPTMTEDYYTPFRNLTTLDGLSHNRILDIKQDAYGFIWIATAHGLNRYDGYTFKTFLHQADDTTSLPDNYVTSIDFDSGGRMWVGTKNGLASYEVANENFVSYSVHSPQQSGISDAYVRRLAADTTEALLWVETADGMLNRIDQRSGDIRHYSHGAIGATTYDYHELFIHPQLGIWLGGRDMGPLRFDDQEQEFISLPVDYLDPDKKRDRDVACIFIDSDTLCWISATDGFYQYYPKQNTFRKRLGTSTFDIIEDDCFHLWLGTGGGLMQYHKYNNAFTVFRHNANNDHSLIHNHVNVIFKDKNANLWVGTAKGLSVLYRKKSLVTHYRHIPEIIATMPFDNVTSFLELNDSIVWIGTTEGVVAWNKFAKRFEVVKGTEGQHISTMHQDLRGDIWLGMWSGRGFLKYDRYGEVKRYALLYNSLKRDWYNDFYEDNKGRLWAGVWGDCGVRFFNREQEEFELYNLRLPEAPGITGLNKLAVQKGHFWVHNKYQSIHRYHPASQQYEGWGAIDTTTFVLPEWRGRHHYNYDDQIAFKKVYRIVSSPAEALTYWCTDDGLYEFREGFNKIVTSSPFAECYSLSFVDDNSLCICTDKGPALLTIDGGEVRFLRDDNSSNFTRVFDLGKGVSCFVSPNEVLLYSHTDEQFLSADLDAAELEIVCSTNDVCIADSLYFATDKGLVIVHASLHGYALHNMDNAFARGLLTDKINTVIQASAHTFWLGTEKGVLLYDAATSSFELVEATLNKAIEAIVLQGDTLWMVSPQGLAYYLPEKEIYVPISDMNEHKLSSHLVSFIEEDHKGNIWVGTTNRGLNSIDQESYEIQQFLPDRLDEKAFWGENVSGFAMNREQTVYISSNAGINVFNAADNTFTHITRQEGLPSDDVLGIAFDADDMLWIVTSEALSVYDYRQDLTFVFDGQWGFTPYLFGGEIRSIGQDMLIASDKGFYRFNPKILRQEQASASPQFTNIKVFANDKQSNMQVSRQLVLNYDENFFTIFFSAFDFSSTPTTFYYKLLGIDPDWVETQQNYAAYTNIKPGTYELLLSTSNSPHLDNSPTSLSIKIVPPFWKKTWFLVLEVIFILSLLTMFYFQRIKQYRRKEKQLQTEQKLLRSQMNPHFVFNALIAIQSFIFKNEPKEAGRYLSKFAKLMRLFLQNTRQDFIALSQELQTLEHYMELQRLRFDNTFDFIINCDESVNAEELNLPPMMAQPFIENAIEHGFKGIDYKGEIHISYVLNTEALEISIRDNGTGIKQEAKQKDHKSLATTITRERLQSLSTTNKKYQLIITDLGKTSNKGTGTLVRLSVPYTKSYTID